MKLHMLLIHEFDFTLPLLIICGKRWSKPIPKITLHVHLILPYQFNKKLLDPPTGIYKRDILYTLLSAD